MFQTPLTRGLSFVASVEKEDQRTSPLLVVSRLKAWVRGLGLVRAVFDVLPQSGPLYRLPIILRKNMTRKMMFTTPIPIMMMR